MFGPILLSRGQPQSCPQGPILLSILFWELALGPLVYFRGCAGGKDTVWASLYTYTCHPSQVWRQVLPEACRTGLAKGLQAAGSVDVGKLANAEGRKTEHPCCLAA